MPFAEATGGCTVIVLAPPAGAGAPEGAGIAALSVLLAEGGPDARIEVFCALPAGVAAQARIRVHPPTGDLAVALRALAERPLAERNLARDVAWIVAGTRAPASWIRRLRASLRTDPVVGTVSPLCVDDPHYSPFDPAAPPTVSDDALDAWLAANQPPTPVQMPAPLALCGVLRADAVAAIASDRQAGDDWALAVCRDGYVHAASTAIAVRAPAGWTSPGDHAPHAAADAAADAAALVAGRAADRADERADAGASLFGLVGLGDMHPLQGLRREIAGALAAHAQGAATPAAQAPAVQPVRLHVAHSWGGGLGAWVRDFCRADADHDGLVLRSVGVIGAFGQRLSLYHGTDPTTPLRVWELDLPIHATAIAHLQYRAILREIVDDFGVDSIVVSSLIGHSLDVLRTSLPTLLVAHDHTPFCIAIFAHFGGECRSCDGARLRECIADNPGHRFFRGAQAADWMALRRAFVETVLRQSVAIVAPSPSTAQRWLALMPELAGARIEVIAHGIDLPPAVPFDAPAEGRLRLVKVGRISPEKGGELLEAALPELLRFAELTLIGCGDEARRLGRHRGVTAIAGFERDELPALIAQARPHLGLQLSTVPETFSYTLSEMWHCGVPVLGCRSGSLADRIREGENGFLCEASIASILARLRELDARRGDLAALRPRLLATSQRSCAQMVADYRALLPPLGQRTARRQVALRGEAAAPASGRVRVGAVSVDPEVTYAQAARAFAGYTLRKAANSPRLPAWLRRAVVGIAQRRARARTRR